jgi:hypothetical protein
MEGNRQAATGVCRGVKGALFREIGILNVPGRIFFPCKKILLS